MPTSPTETVGGSPEITLQTVFDTLREFISEQRDTNHIVHSKQEQLLDWMAESSKPSTTTTTTPSKPVDVEVEDEEKEPSDYDMEDRRQRHNVRHSRQSVHVSNSNNSTVYGDGILTPLPEPVPRAVRTTQEKARRESHGLVLESPVTSSKLTSVRPLSPVTVPGGPHIDRSKNSKYDQANTAMSKLDKFYGDRKHDKDVDVYAWVRGIDFQLKRWMGADQVGRLELVISCTAGQAQTWLLNKQQDLLTLVQRGVIRPEYAEWEWIKDEFIEKMGGGQTQRLYQAKLEELKLGKGKDSDEVTKFVSRFYEYAMRAYPLHKHPDTETRSLMLGQLFGKRLRDSDVGVWKEAMRQLPRPDTLEQWEEALFTAWTTEQLIRDQLNKRWPDSTKGGYSKSSSTSIAATAASASHSLQHVDVDDETEDSARGEGETDDEALNTVASKAKSGGGQKRANNKHINGKIASQLIRLNRCLHCYQPGHFARECKAPANRAPKESELKV